MLSIREKKHKKKNDKGFALFYVLLVIGVVLIASSVFVDTALEDFFISFDREKSDKAFYISEAGVECALYHQRRYGAFNMRSEEREYCCNDNEVCFSAGWRQDVFEEDGENFLNDIDTCYRSDSSSFVAGLMDDDDYSVSDYVLFEHLDPFVIWDKDDISCARVSVVVLPERRVLLDDEFISCRISIKSVGASECEIDGTPAEGAAERTRIEKTTN